MFAERERNLQNELDIQKDKTIQLANDTQLLLDRIDVFEIQKIELEDKIKNLENDNLAMMK